MDIGAKKQTVVYAMLAILCNGLNVGSFQCGECFFTGDSATAIVGVCDENTESTLTKSLSNQCGIVSHDSSIADLELQSWFRPDTRQDRITELSSRSRVYIVRFALDNV